MKKNCSSKRKNEDYSGDTMQNLKKFGFAYIIGNKGSGKTVFATAMAYIDFLSGAPVYLNYPVGFKARSNDIDEHGLPSSMSSEDIIELFNENPRAFRGSTVVFDEAQMAASSRSFFAKSNKKLVEFIAMLRKLKCTLIITSQKYKKVDKWVREDAEFVIVMEPEHPELEENENFWFEVYDQQADSLMGFLHEERLVNSGWFHGREIFKLYDTDALISYEKTVT